MLHFDPLSVVSVRRTFDAAAVNAICNHPDVLPGLSLGLDAVDVTGLLGNARNICFLGRHGGAIMVWTGPGVYDAHDFFLPAGRGGWAREACRTILTMMFEGYDARLVWAQTPVEHRACRMFNRLLGFRSEGVQQAVLRPDAGSQAVEVFVMERGQCR